MSVAMKMRLQKGRRNGDVKRQSDLEITRKKTAQELFFCSQKDFSESTESFLSASNCIFK